MMITISFRLISDNQEITIMVDCEQQIWKTLKILCESAVFSTSAETTIYLERTNSIMQPEWNYREAGVLDGDVLILE